MNLSPLTAISPVDGRYRSKTESLDAYFSEFALIKYRVRVEIEYFIALCELPLPQLKNFDQSKFTSLREIYEGFSLEDAEKVKEFEKVTNHDVKSVEYFIKEEFERLEIAEFSEFVHFGLTSQDINNTAIPLAFKEACESIVLNSISEIQQELERFAEKWAEIPMLAFTHGQPASPTKLGKEIKVFAYRIAEQLRSDGQIEFPAKFGGATGNFNAHVVAYPDFDWVDFGNHFVNNTFGLHRSQFTT